ncbi:hypothetical protein PHYBLDRAFT_181561 [Phycomyces blakesleeanus NRRL 1555(-)]|uniref:VASt domain-containing protein n=1 Tax=Phycomyces blakesleeanus (strain ATCC 8743b / DSM 1359 / FGSC 10004 / NBRC 33097 / NRRL 1555) TaxID=763407 RepID=A0A167MQ15_PHYB8|nr:hypothetical protein PHYBLDRAFT_181561 [Phycomyces blakesleeanus NRRL 1555(-)]OAD73499.1 hypothetical protein PHYBLDRAFT_181561 [Phycomyces blakesleeanus NRRL 1555(-)]|eukprot:XP_018291539.1 hypothetical protein PHYBLDRAFT_181561 [Phycomyces blakesleeanus NRRL 1555(-)]
MTDTDLLHTLLPSRDRSSSSPANPNERPEIHKKPSYTSLQDRLTVHDVRTPDTPTTTKKHHRNSLSGSFRLRKHISSENLEDGDKRRSLPPASNSTTHLDTHVLDTVPATETLLGGCSPASEKANRDFHTLFRSVPSTDRLVDIYKCAIHKDILNQGHLYVSEHHVCFKSNIFGWVTTLVLAFTEITAIEKRMTARIIPNGLTISTVGADHVFASLLFRDETYELLIKLWKLHQSPAVIIEQPIQDEFDRVSEYDDNHDYEASTVVGNNISTTTTISNGYTNNNNNKDIINGRSITSPSLENIIAQPQPQFQVQSQPQLQKHNLLPGGGNENDNHNNHNHNNNNNNNSGTISASSEPKEVARSLVSEKATSATSFLYNLLPPSTPLPGPLRNPTTTATPLPHTCTCTTKRDPYPMVALDHTFAGTVETMYRILFDSDFMKNYLEKKENQKDVKMGQWIHGRRDNVYKLSSGVQCSSSNQILHRHMPTHVAVATSTRTPQASVGSIFVIKSRTCIRQVDPLQVHVKVTFKTKFIPSGLVSSIIERNVIEGLTSVFGDLAVLLEQPNIVRGYTVDQDLLNRIENESERRRVAEMSGLRRAAYSFAHSATSLVGTCASLVGSARSLELSLNKSQLLVLAMILIVCWHIWLAYRIHVLVDQVIIPPLSMENPVSPHDSSLEWAQENLKSIENMLNILQKDAREQREQLINFVNI